jgi:predicted SAM-dependent methyltransferase
MININVGGTKKWASVSQGVREQWKILDVAGTPDYVHDLNAGEPLPFADNEVDNVYTSHTLEHVRHWLVIPLLTDIHRVLKPGGKIRIVVPNIRIHLKAYMRGDVNWQEKSWRKRRQKETYPNTHLGALLGYFYSYVKTGNRRDGHHMAFDWETLEWCVSQAGFQKIARLKYNECSSVFRGLDFATHAKFSLYLEAIK